MSDQEAEMSHTVDFRVPLRPLGRSDVEFVVRQNDEKFGVLRISRGSLVWFPRNSPKGRRVGWERFDEFMRGRPAQETR